MREASALYRLLGDEGRLRLLRVLARERLNVTELTGVLGLAQSGVSRHLGLLKDAGLVEEDKDGGFSYYRLTPTLASGAGTRSARCSTGSSRRPRTTRWSVPTMPGCTRCCGSGRRTSRATRDPTHATRRQLVPGRSWAAWSRALGMLLPPLTVADLGCGEGYLTMEAARWASRVIAVDRSDAVLRRARGLAGRRRVTNVIWKRGELERLPIADGQVDVAMLSQALHHAEQPARAVAEAARVTAAGGRVLVLDLRTHNETWVRGKLGDRVLGFADAELERMLTSAGLKEVRVGVGARSTGDPFTVLLASGTKPNATTKTRRHEH